jgi:mRNA interferase HigB
MIVVGKNHLSDFKQLHSDARSQVDAWLKEVEAAKWISPQDIKKRYSSASFLGENRVVFNLKGNNYRLDIKVSYKHQTVFVVRIGTHAEYSKWSFS